MYGRQAYNNPFQPFGITNPLQQFTGGLPQFGTGTGFGGINPLAAQWSGFGANPFLGAQAFGINPLISGINPFLGVGTPQAINPILTAQIAATNPALAQLLTTNPALAQIAATNPALLSVLTPQGVSPYGGQGFGSPFGFTGQSSSPYHIISGYGGQSGQPTVGAVNPHLLNPLYANPILATEPSIGSMLAQQLNPLVNPLAQQQLPIRPLISPQQYDFSQGGIGGLTGNIAGQADLYSPIVQAQLATQLAASQLQQAQRPFIGSPWMSGVGVPSLMGQTYPFAQTGIPYVC